MFKVWTASDDDAGVLARTLEAHLNEFADIVVSVSYCAASTHSVMAVYRAIEPIRSDSAEAILAEAESVLDES